MNSLLYLFYLCVSTYETYNTGYFSMGSPHKNKFTQYFTLAALLLLGIILLYSLRGFIDAFLGAIIFYVMGRPVMRYLTLKKKWNKNLASGLIILISFTVIVLLVVLTVKLIIPKLNFLFSDTSIIVHMMNKADELSLKYTGNALMDDNSLGEFRNNAASYFRMLLGETLNIVADIGVMLFIVFYLFKYTGFLEQTLEKSLPIEPNNLSKFAKELHDQTFSNVVGSPLLALIQGFVAALGYWFFGIQDPLFWGLVTGFFSFLPIVGSGLIWVPAALYLFTTGSMWQGFALLAYGIFIISIIDNMLRMIFQNIFADVHPVVTILGVISGLMMFGVPGIIFGPLLISYFIILFKIYRDEYMLK